MFDNINSPSISVESENAPSFAYTATSVFGNTQFSLQAPLTKGKVEPGFPAVDYVSLEQVIFFQDMSNPNNNPTLTLPGSNTGEQVTAGQITQADANGTSRYSQGTQLG